MNAGTYIRLTDGFVSGSSFLAMIAPCENNVVVISAMVNDEDSIETKSIISAIDSNVQLKIYPTVIVSGNALKIEATANIQDVTFVVSDMQGKIVQSQIINQLNAGEATAITLPNLSVGMYFVKANNSSISITQKIIIE